MWYAGLFRLTWWNLRHWVGLLVFATAAVFCRIEFNELSISEARQVRLIDAWSYMSGNKSSVSEHWKGTFIELESGKRFEYELSGSLYRQFNKDDKPIDMTLDLKPGYWNVDRAGLASTYEFLFWLFAALAAWLNLRLVFLEDPKIYPNNKWFCL
jgi:hypothetical protein